MSKKPQHKKNKFNRFYNVHHCTIQTNDDEDDLHDLIPGKTNSEKIKRWFVSQRLAAEWICKSSSIHLRSHGSVVKEQRRQLMQYPRIIHPYSEFVFCWTILMCLVNTVQLATAPIEGVLAQVPGGMFPGMQSHGFTVARFLLDLLCCVDIGINFFTGYYDDLKKEVELSHKQTVIRYLKTKFIMHLITSIPTQWEMFAHVDKTTKMVGHSIAMVKVVRLYDLDRDLTILCNLYGMNYYKRQLSFIVIKMLLIWYLIACVQFFIKLLTGRITELGFLFNRGLLSKNMFFSLFLYDGAQIIYQMSLGSLVPQKNYSRVVSQMIFWVMSQVFQIYVLARCIEFISSREASNDGYVRIQNQLKEFMRHRQLPVHIQRRILKYYEYHYQKNFYNEERIMSTISSQLGQEITMQKCRLLVENVDFFKGIPLTLLMRVVSFLRLETFMENDVVIKAGYPGNSMYFILNGTVAVYTQNGKEISHLVDGAYFGEIALVSKNNIRIATVVALETCTLYRLDRQDFNRAIQPYPDLLETIQRVAHERHEDCLNAQTKQGRVLDSIRREKFPSEGLRPSQFFDTGIRIFHWSSSTPRGHSQQLIMNANNDYLFSLSR